MYQYDDSTVVSQMPTPGPSGTPGYFTDGNAALQQPATLLRADFMNAVMLELLNVVTAAGITPSKTQYTQILTAIETLIQARSGDYLLDTGAANAYVVSPNPPITSYPNGLTVKFRATHANSQACTLNAGPGPEPLVRDDGTPMQLGDIEANAVLTCTYDLTANAFLVNSIVLSQLGALAQLGIGANLYQDGAGNLAASIAPLYVNSAMTLFKGVYLVDTSTGGFSLTLPATPSKGSVITFIDASATWGVNTWVLAHNGNTIMGQSANLTVNLSDQQFSIWYNGSDWRLV